MPQEAERWGRHSLESQQAGDSKINTLRLAVTDERIEQAREVLLWVQIGGDPDTVIASDMQPALAELQRKGIDAYRRGDVAWILDHADPAIEIVQPPEFPDRRTYRGHEGLIDSILDWPRQRERFHLEVRRVFAAGDGQVISVVLHRRRARLAEIEVEAEIFWLMRWHEDRMTRFDMFMTLEDALQAAQRIVQSPSTAAGSSPS